MRTRTAATGRVRGTGAIAALAYLTLRETGVELRPQGTALDMNVACSHGAAYHRRDTDMVVHAHRRPGFNSVCHWHVINAFAVLRVNVSLVSVLKLQIMEPGLQTVISDEPDIW